MSKNQVQDGKVLTLVDSQLVKPTHTDGFAHNGDPVVAGTLVGVVVDSALAVNGNVDIATEGVWSLSVLAKHAGAVNDAVAVGDQIYIDGATAVLSKDATKTPFGKALAAVNAGATAIIAVKIVQPGALAALTQSGPATDSVTHAVANGAIAVASGTVGLGSGGALAMTLAAPANPGDDGKQLYVVAETAHAHTVTTPANTVKNPAWLGVDKPFTQQLAQALSRNAKFAVVNKEFFYLGEYYNGQTVVIPHSPVDGYAYSAAEATFLCAPRWTPPGNTSSLTPPALSNGQLGPFMFSVNSSGVVSTTVKCIDDGGNLNSTNDGRVAVFAFFKRSGTPATLGAVADLFSEIDYDNFMPGDALPSSLIDQVVENILQSLVEVETFGPTNYANGDTIALPVSPVDGYAYARDELSYFPSWSDTSNQTGSNLRLPLFFGHIDPATGVVTLHVWRLPPGGPYVDDDDALARISVVIVARRKTIAPTAWHAPESSTPPTGATTTGGNVVADVPTLSGATAEAAGGSINSSNQAFTISAAGKILFLVWNGQVRFDFSQSGISTSFTTTFTPDTGDTLYAVYTT